MSHLKSILVLAGALLTAVLGAPAPASAQSFTCEASAIRGQILTAPAIEPVTANKGQATCQTAHGGGANVLPAPLSTSLISASTTLSGPAGQPLDQIADATGGLADLRVTLPDPAVQAINQIRQQVVSQALANVPPISLPNVGTIDLNAAATRVLTPLNNDLLRITGATSFARARCTDGAVSLAGSSQVLGIRVLGLEVPVNQLVEQTVNVVGGQTINFSQIDISQLLPGVNLTPLQQLALRPLLAAIPPIEIPAQVITARVTPAEQERTATRLTQRALRVQLGLAGQSLLDLTVGEASVGANDVSCSPAAATTAAALECTTRSLVLIDVVQRGRRVRLTGAADARHIGSRVDIFLKANGRRVATALVNPDGTFDTTAPLPARRIRNTDRARYQARIGRERSLNLKLRRRMVVDSVNVSGDQVRIRGRVVRPLARPPRSIEVRRRVSCTRSRVVARIRPDRRGRFSVRVAAPPSQQAAVYRFTTSVPRITRSGRMSRRLSPTFTLPRYVDLGRS